MIKTEMIDAYMQENNLSKTAFCKMCKISTSTFKKIMANDSNFGIIALFKIARVMGIYVHQLFNK